MTASNYIIDYKKLSKYIDFNVMITSKIHDKDIRLVSGFRSCKVEDFTPKGIDKSFWQTFDIDSLYCPDTDSIKEQYKLKNTFYNNHD